MTISSSTKSDVTLSGRKVLLAGKLASVSRRDAENLIRESGGRLVERETLPDLIVLPDETRDWKQALSERGLFSDATRQAYERGELEVLRESEFWTRLVLVDAGPEVARLYTPAMLAELLGVPITAVRQWHRKGALRATREVQRLAYFDFDEVRVARKLADLLAAGCTLHAINRKLDELAMVLPGVPRPLMDPAVVVEGRRLYVRRGESLTEPSGQLLIDFEAAPQATSAAAADQPMTIPFSTTELFRSTSPLRPRDGGPQFDVDELRSLASELEEEGRRRQSIEVCRAILFSGTFSADDHFTLAELLYLENDLAGARERYYMAIELDEDFVEARSNLGCVLAESGELELAEAAFRGALEYHPHYADAHYHLARLLDRTGRSEEAVFHWQQFLKLAPASPWADEAGERVVGHRSE